MADILLKRDSTLAATYVPNTFIDEYMTQADGEFVKIYLYLLRCMNHPDTMCSISDIADKFDHTEKDVTRALRYWEKMRLLRLEFNDQKELTGICLSDLSSHTRPRACTETPVSCAAHAQTGTAAPGRPADNSHLSKWQPVTDESITRRQPADESVTEWQQPANESVTGRQQPTDEPALMRQQDMDEQILKQKAANGPVSKQAAFAAATDKHPLPKRTSYSLNQLAKFNEDETVQEILFVTERYLGHPLNNTEIQMILYWLDKLEFSQDMIEYLIEQCVARNHMSIRYMDKIALSWAEAGIHTLTDAKQASEIHSSAVHAVRKAFGITNRTLAESELEFVEKWSKEYNFSDEIIALACQKTILRIHQISFTYADTILSSWRSQNVRTLNDIRLLDAQYQETKAKKITAGKAAARTAKGTIANGFANFPQRTYNYDELERELLSYSR